MNCSGRLFRVVELSTSRLRPALDGLRGCRRPAFRAEAVSYANKTDISGVEGPVAKLVPEVLPEVLPKL